MIGDKIKQVRIDKKLKQEEVAKAVGVTQQTILKWEKGDYEPKVSQIQKLSKYYGIPTCDLIDEESTEMSVRLRASLQLVEQLTEEEKKTAMTILEALVMKSQAEKTRMQFKDMK